MKISKYNFLTLVFFLSSPLLGFVTSSVFVLKNKSIKFHNFIVSIFFSLIVMKNPPLFDLYRYYNQYLYLDYSNFFENIDFFIPILMHIFKYMDLPFYILPSFVLFLTLYLILQSFYLFYKKFNFKASYYLVGVLCIVVLVQPISVSIGMRSYLSYAFFIYGVSYLYFHKNYKGWIFLLISCLTHISSVYLVGVYFLSNFIKISKKYSLVLGIFFIFISNIILPFMLSLFPITSVRDYFVKWYVDKEGLYSFNTINDFFMAFIPVFFSCFLYLIYFFVYRNNENLLQNKFSNFISVFFLGITLVSMSPTALARYSYVFNIILFMFLLSNRIILKNKIVSFLFFLLIIIMFFTHNINIPKRSLYYGEPVKQALYPPISIILYSKEDYDKFLNNIDERGYLNDDIWERNR